MSNIRISTMSLTIIGLLAGTAFADAGPDQPDPDQKIRSLNRLLPKNMDLLFYLDLDRVYESATLAPFVYKWCRRYPNEGMLWADSLMAAGNTQARTNGVFIALFGKDGRFGSMKREVLLAKSLRTRNMDGVNVFTVDLNEFVPELGFLTLRFAQFETTFDWKMESVSFAFPDDKHVFLQLDGTDLIEHAIKVHRGKVKHDVHMHAPFSKLVATNAGVLLAPTQRGDNTGNLKITVNITEEVDLRATFSEKTTYDAIRLEQRLLQGPDQPMKMLSLMLTPNESVEILLRTLLNRIKIERKQRDVEVRWKLRGELIQPLIEGMVFVCYVGKDGAVTTAEKAKQVWLMYFIRPRDLKESVMGRDRYSTATVAGTKKRVVTNSLIQLFVTKQGEFVEKVVDEHFGGSGGLKLDLFRTKWVSHNGKPKLHERIVYYYNEHMEMVDSKYFDAEGKLIPTMVIVNDILEESQAEESGVQRLDRIISHNGTPIRTVEQFLALRKATNDTVRVRFGRDRNRKTEVREVTFQPGKIGFRIATQRMPRWLDGIDSAN